MADVTIKHIDDLPGHEGRFLYAGRALGVTAWGMNVLKLPPNWPDYPEHDELKDGQEEVYVVLSGSATLHAGGAPWPLKPGGLARVGPAEKRKIVPGGAGVVLLALGGTPGKAYTPPDRAKSQG
jgi:mannose-6-phosphate isomerase-like protein (cupin superfamily)